VKTEGGKGVILTHFSLLLSIITYFVDDNRHGNSIVQPDKHGGGARHSPVVLPAVETHYVQRPAQACRQQIILRKMNKLPKKA
jgi:hypothetical protein